MDWLLQKQLSKIFKNLKLKWNPRYFKALGIIFSTNIGEMTHLNFNPKLFEIKQIINIWMKRLLTPLGRIAVIKLLLISKLSYLLLIHLKHYKKNYMKYVLDLYGIKNQLG